MRSPCFFVVCVRAKRRVMGALGRRDAPSAQADGEKEAKHMTEWAVVGVLIALAGLFVTVAKPIITLNRNITELTMTVKAVKTDMDSLSVRNAKSHERIWQHNDEQDRQLADHASRIVRLEGQEKQEEKR